VIFAYGKHEATVGMDSNIAESERALRGDRPWPTVGSDGVEAAIGEL
jgi:hypothetical protein